VFPFTSGVFFFPSFFCTGSKSLGLEFPPFPRSEVSPPPPLSYLYKSCPFSQVLHCSHLPQIDSVGRVLYSTPPPFTHSYQVVSRFAPRKQRPADSPLSPSLPPLVPFKSLDPVPLCPFKKKVPCLVARSPLSFQPHHRGPPIAFPFLRFLSLDEPAFLPTCVLSFAFNNNGLPSVHFTNNFSCFG